MDLGSDSIFSYSILRSDRQLICNGCRLEMKSYSVFVSTNTEYSFREEENFACLIIGVSICLCEDMSAMDWIWKHGKTIESIINAEKYLGGKYVLFVRIKDHYYAMGDATGSVPVFYAYDGDAIACASLAFQLADTLHFVADKNLLKIRQHGDTSQTMPYDYTIWKEIKRLLPNHYLDINTGRAVRFLNHHSLQEELTAEDVAEKTIPYMKRLASFYKNKFSVASALTSGRDSRAVSAVMGCEPEIPVYTMKHAEFTEDTPDIVIPRKIAERVNLNYHQITDVSLTENEISYADSILGKDNYNKRTLMLAHTIKHYWGEYAVINGDVIGQVGKCSLHRDIPCRFATPSYFLCKLHNYSKEAKLALGRWLQEVQESDEYVNIFDLFSIENRLGVWAANENEIYNLIGQNYLNVFNSRSIIYEWTRVSRKERKNSAIHLAVIRALKPELLEIPFEPSAFVEKISKYNGYTYLFASYFKHYIEKIRSRL